MTMTPSDQADFTGIDRFLDGRMSTDEARAFERRIESEPELARTLGLHRAIGEVLRRAVRLPGPGLAAEQLARALEAARDLPVPARSPARPFPLATVPLLAAAAGLIALVVALAIWSGAIPTGTASAVSTPYAAALADGFRPSIPESDPAALELTIAEKLGATFTLPRTRGLRYLGIRTDPGGSPLNISVLLLADGRKILLAFDRVGTTHPATAHGIDSHSTGHFRHEHIVGPIRLIEWSESETPVVAVPKAR